MKVLSFGEVLWDLIEGEPHLGGAPLNFAAHIVQCGGRAAIYSRVGNDKFGTDARKRIMELGVDDSLLQTDKEYATGTVPVTLTQGQPDYYITPNVAYDHIDYGSMVSLITREQFNVLYFGTLAQRGSSGKTLRQVLTNHQFDLKFYDINLRKDCYTPEIIKSSLGVADVAKLNEDEVIEISEMLFDKRLLPEKFVEELQGRYPQLRHVVLTAGGEGCYVYKDHALHHVKSEPVEVVDAIGAGDSFSAAFLYAFFKTGDIIRSAKIGNQVGGYVASSSGAIPIYSQEIKQLLHSL